MNPSRRLSVVALALVLMPLVAIARTECDAYFAFDGNLSDSGGNGYDGQMIGKGGSLTSAEYVPGRSGQALRLSGNSAMRAFVDLHPEACPQVTISAWIRVDGKAGTRTESIISSGSGSGPGLRVSGTTLGLNGTGNGLLQPKALRENADWMFVAGVYDYEKSTYTLYWRNRSIDGKLSENRRDPEEAIWVGAFNDGLSSAASNILIDDLRIVGQALSLEDLQALQIGETEKNLVAVTPVSGLSAEAQLRNPGAMPVTAPEFARAGATAPPQAGQQIPLSAAVSAEGGSTGLSKPLPGATAATGMTTQVPAGTDVVSEAAQENAIPQIGYASEAEALAAQERREREAYQEELARQQNELEAQRRADAAAAATATSADASNMAEPEYYPTGAESITEYSGTIGIIERRMDLIGFEAFFHAMEWGEVRDRPCQVRVRADATQEASVSFNCSGWGIWGSPSLRGVATAADAPVYAIQVCNNWRNAKRRLKGIRIWGAKINPDGTTAPANVNDEEELNNCNEWAPRRTCPSNQIATGVVVMANDAGGGDNKADITGLRLICHKVGVR